MLIEEFGPNITHIKGCTNTVANTLSRLNFNSDVSNKKHKNLTSLKPIEHKNNFNVLHN